jgi:hypothetical protein
MTFCQRVAAELETIYSGPAWHGPALAELLSEVSAVQAARRLDGTHSIWELVHHITAWHSIVSRRLAGERLVEIPDEQNFPPVGSATEGSWKESRERLARSHQELMEAVANFPDQRIDETVRGKDYSYQHMILGIGGHTLYHAGQVALIKKASSSEKP